MTPIGNSKGIFVSWRQITAKVKETTILENCSGYCQPGTTLAIMGPSGAGKTTLLSILAKKAGKQLTVTGKVQANNQPYTSSDFYSFASFVFQNDILNEVLTVKETLQFIAKLKIKDDEEAQRRVTDLINKFELRKCADTYVGGKIVKGISGGEKKRVCIAAEMVSEPKVLILDEPTSGLDSHIANRVIKILKKVSEEGRTVILTIHQPSYKIYSQLDKLILLNKGHVVYQGKADGISSYMQQRLEISIPHNTTICDYFMFQISDYKFKNVNKESSLNTATYSKYLLGQIEDILEDMSQKELQPIQNRKPVRNMLEQFIILFNREWRLYLRNPMRLGRSIGNSVLTIIIVGLIFLHGISDDRPDPIQSGKSYELFALIIYFIYSQGLCFINTTSILMSGIFSVALVFPVEREVFAKETASKTYNAFPYFMSKLIIEVLSLFLSIIVFASGSYWMMGFTAEFGHFVTFTFILCVLGLVGNSIGLMTGSLFKDAQKASSMAPALLLPLMTFSGLYNKLNDIPSWISWLQYISPFRYGLHAILLNEFGDETYLAYQQQSPAINFSYRQDLAINLSLSTNVGILLGLAVFYYSLSFIFLKKLSSNLSV